MQMYQTFGEIYKSETRRIKMHKPWGRWLSVTACKTLHTYLNYDHDNNKDVDDTYDNEEEDTDDDDDEFDDDSDAEATTD